MQTKAPHLRELILPVAFGLICVVLTLGAFRVFGGPLPLAPKGYRVDVPVPNAQNLVPGSDVQTSGVRIGDVINIRRAGNGAIATVELKDEFAPVRSDVKVTPRLKTLVGEGYLEFTPGSRSADPVPEGAQLAKSQVKPAQSLDEFLEIFDPPTRKRFQRMYSGMAQALEGRADELNNALGRLAPFSANFADVLAVLDEQQSQLQRLVAGGADMYGALGRREGVLQAAITAGNEVFGVTARRNRELASFVRAMPPFLRQLRSTSRTVSAASPELNRAATAMLSVSPHLEPALREARVFAPEVRRLFQTLPATLSAGRRGLPALTRLERAQPPAFRRLYPLAREVIPSLMLLGDNWQGTVGVLANVGSMANGRYLTTDGRHVPYIAGVATVWNEAIGGWKKRLPSNRSNVVPQPGSLSDIYTGAMKSFDCRHVNNPNYLPPTGTGQVPCLEQGPWEFNGERRYYPHLELAPP